ncbi:hypothetical protein H8959_006732 [Pygathrix nigripes]
MSRIGRNEIRTHFKAQYSSFFSYPIGMCLIIQTGVSLLHPVDRMKVELASEPSEIGIFHDLCVDSLPASDDEDLSVATKHCVLEKVSEPLPGLSHEKGTRIVNGKGEGPPAKHPSLKDFHNHEEMKDLMDENCILKTDVAILRQEICTMKHDNLEKENKCLTDIKIVKEINAYLEKSVKLNEETITKTTFQYQQELHDLKAENTGLNSKLLKEKESKARLEAEIESYQARLAAAISKHSESAKTERNLRVALERTQDVSLQVKMTSDISEVEDKNEFLTEQLSKMQIKLITLKDKFCKTRDTLRKSHWL